VQVLVGKPKGKTPLRRSSRRWNDNIKANVKVLGCGGKDWIELV
jgi:hypothetical protein